MNDEQLKRLLNSTGKTIFIDWIKYCIDDSSNKTVIQKIKAQEGNVYTPQSYETRVGCIRKIINSDRLNDALWLIHESKNKQLSEATKHKALELLNELELKHRAPPPFSILSFGGDKMAYTKARIGQTRFRKSLIKKWKACSVTGYQDTSLLIASHIKPWNLSSKNEKTDVYNGLLLLPNLDKVFDNGLISFDCNGKILISRHLNCPSVLGINKKMSVKLSEKHKPYMNYHVDTIFKK